MEEPGRDIQHPSSKMFKIRVGRMGSGMYLVLLGQQHRTFHRCGIAGMPATGNAARVQ